MDSAWRRPRHRCPAPASHRIRYHITGDITRFCITSLKWAVSPAGRLPLAPIRITGQARVTGTSASRRLHGQVLGNIRTRRQNGGVIISYHSMHNQPPPARWLLACRLRPSSSFLLVSCFLRAAMALARPSVVIPRASAIFSAQNDLGIPAPTRTAKGWNSKSHQALQYRHVDRYAPRTVVCLGLVVMQRVGLCTYMDKSARLTRLFGLMAG